jgi:integrase
MGTRAIHKLSALAVKRTTEPGYYGDGGGLWLRVSRTGTKSWVFRYKVSGTLREMGLGSLSTVSLAGAREKAAKCRQMRSDGLDPLETQNAKKRQITTDAGKTGLTFEHYAERYIVSMKVGWRGPRTEPKWRSGLATYVYPILGKLQPESIDLEVVLKVLQQQVCGADGKSGLFWETKPAMAEIVRSHIERVLDYARVLLRGSDEKLARWDNPARWEDNLAILLPSRSKVSPVKHYAALGYSEIPVFMGDLRQRTDLGAVPLEFMILTLARPGRMLTGMRWPEVDFTEEVWSIPGGRMKTGRDFRVPLSKAAIFLLTKLQATSQGDLVFPGSSKSGSIGHNLVNELVKAMGRDDATAHGFRSTFDTWAAEKTKAPTEVREMALAHTIGGRNSDVQISAKLYETYQRGELLEKRRELMEAWADFCTPSVPERDRGLGLSEARSSHPARGSYWGPRRRRGEIARIWRGITA